MPKIRMNSFLHQSLLGCIFYNTNSYCLFLFFFYKYMRLESFRDYYMLGDNSIKFLRDKAAAFSFP